MLPAARRLTEATEFRRTTRHGRRAASGRVVVHVLADVDQPGPARIGLAVGRPVGGSVCRNRVKRRLRHLLADRLDLLPASGSVVVRALPASSGATSAELGADLTRCLRRATGSTEGAA